MEQAGLVEHAVKLITNIHRPDEFDCKSLARLRTLLVEEDIDKGDIKGMIDTEDVKISKPAANQMLKNLKNAVMENKAQGEKKEGDREKSACKFERSKMTPDRLHAAFSVVLGRGQFGTVFKAWLMVTIGDVEQKITVSRREVREEGSAGVGGEVVFSFGGEGW